MSLNDFTSWRYVLVIVASGLGSAAVADSSEVPAEVPTEKKAAMRRTFGDLSFSAFHYRESGDDAIDTTASASPLARSFIEARARVEGKQLGRIWNTKFDGRARWAANPSDISDATEDPASPSDTRSQAGLLGESEVEVREAWLERKGGVVDVRVGRSVLADALAQRLDGLSVATRVNPAWIAHGYAGLLPMRGSRSITTDYPSEATLPGTGRVVPIAAGVGTSYDTGPSYGAFGIGTQIPRGGESARVFLHSQGYLRAGATDVHHLVAADVLSEAGFTVTQASLAAGYQASTRFRASASLHHVDTDTLQRTAESFLRDPQGSSIPTNETTVRRIASQQLRVGGALALDAQETASLNASVALRRRPSVALSDTLSMPEGRSAEVTVGFIHRDVWKKLRLALDGTRMQGLGETSYAHTDFWAASLVASRPIASERGEWGAEVAWASASPNTAADPSIALGSAATTSLSVGGNMLYQINAQWLAFASVQVGRYNVSEASTVTGLTFFARATWRFGKR